MEIEDLMNEATAGLHPSPTLLHDVRKGGQRRRRTRRVVTAAGTAGLVAVGVLGYPLVSAPTFTQHYAGTLFDGRVHGDLKADPAFLRDAVTAWNASHKTSGNASRGIFQDLRGEAHVVWAGTTPAGNAALVEQDAFLHRHGDIQLKHEGIYSLLGFIGAGADGKPVVVGDTYPTDRGDGVETNAWFVDPARTVLAVAENGGDFGVSTGWIYDTKVHRDFTPIPHQDGVGVVHLTKPATSAVHVAHLPVRGITDMRVIAGAEQLSTNYQAFTLPWRDKIVLAGAAAGTGNALQTFAKTLNTQILDQASIVGYGSWSVRGATPDGRQFLASEIRLENDPSHAYALVGTDLVAGPQIDPHTVLPVAVALPDAQGWVVAAIGATLKYRIRSGAWVSAGRDAALLPASATAVQVTAKGGAPVVVNLRKP
jgi:hypothetical protein